MDTRNKLFQYKNFNMGTELDIAGVFIYDGMKTFNDLHEIYYESDTFSVLYHFAVGIERLQKVLVVLIDNITEEQVKEFEESLITHSQQALHERIISKTDIKFTSRENGFLALLSNFYKEGRYNRFNVGSNIDFENDIFIKYIERNCEEKYFQIDQFNGRGLLLNEHIKKIIGKTVGKISITYYDEIRKYAGMRNIYTDELRVEHKAQKVFLDSKLANNSLYEMLLKEKHLKEEIIVYLCNAELKGGLSKLIKGIEPLNLNDWNLAEIISMLVNDNCSLEVIYALEDEMPEKYSKSELKERTQMLDLIECSNIDFDYGALHEIHEALNAKEKNLITQEAFIVKIREALEWVDDEEARTVLESILISADENDMVKYSQALNECKEFFEECGFEDA